MCFHLDNGKISHLIQKVVDKMIEWLQSVYENVFEDGTGQMNVHCGKTHKYLGMSLDFRHANQCRVTMSDYIDEIVVAYDKAFRELSDGFSAVKKKKNLARTSAAPDGLFIVDKDAEKLSEVFLALNHNLVTKTLYVSKHTRPDISTAVAFLTTRVRAPDIDDWRN